MFSTTSTMPRGIVTESRHPRLYPLWKQLRPSLDLNSGDWSFGALDIKAWNIPETIRKRIHFEVITQVFKSSWDAASVLKSKKGSEQPGYCCCDSLGILCDCKSWMLEDSFFLLILFFSEDMRTSDCPLSHTIFSWICGVVWGNFWPVWLPPMLGAWCAQTVAWRCPRLPRPWACWLTWQMRCEVYCRDLGTVARIAKRERFFRVWNFGTVPLLSS